jgi:nitroimidazol reductase NimA-like FMN-containing flavoprotein (pyridoxamine 5'-phosphate oxidase superfamily)
MGHVEYAHTAGIDDAEMEDRLRRAETGVLSLARDGDAYGVPLSHYYDGDGLYFRLGVTADSEKRAFWESTGTASYVLYGTDPTDAPRELNSWSVVVTGRLVELPAAARERFDTAEINRRFSPIRIFDEPIEDVEIVLAELEIEAMTGRYTP